MTVQSTISRNDYTANGSTSTFSYAFRITEDEDLLVTVADTSTTPVSEHELTLDTDYTVTGVGASAGGTIVLVNNSQAWLNGSGDLIDDYTITIRRVPLLEQLDSFRDLSTFYPSDIEDALDYIVFQVQDLWDRIRHAPKFRESSTAWDDLQFPDLVSSLAGLALSVDPTGTFLQFSSAGQITGYVPPTGSLYSGTTVSGALTCAIPQAFGSKTGSPGPMTYASNAQIPLVAGIAKQTWVVAGVSGAVTGITLPNGTGYLVGQRAVLIGGSNTNTLEVAQGASGTALAGNLVLSATSSGSDSAICELEYDGSNWQEVTRT